MEILRQLGDLFLQAVPTVIIVFLFYLFMRWAFFTPIQKAMAERAKNLKAQRSLARKEVDEAKKRIEAELAEARKEVERQTPELAGAIARGILAGGNPPRGGARQ